MSKEYVVAVDLGGTKTSLMTLLGNIYIKDKYGNYVFSADEYFKKSEDGNYIKIEEDHYFYIDSNNKLHVLSKSISVDMIPENIPLFKISGYGCDTFFIAPCCPLLLP